MPHDDRLIIALSGGPGSGKTTVAGALAAKLGGTAAGFGDYVRHLAVAGGATTDRATLQRIGREAVEQDPASFVSGFLDWAKITLDKPVIIEGVRHVAIDAALRAWAQGLGRRYLLILLDVSAEDRAERRCKGDVEALRHIDEHAVERETVEALPSKAELIVDGTGPIDDVLALIARSAPADLRAALA
jgi:cytidylate kinase